MSIVRSEALVYNSYFFKIGVLRKLFDSRFSYEHCNFSRGCLLVKMASKTMMRAIVSNNRELTLPLSVFTQL